MEPWQRHTDDVAREKSDRCQSKRVLKELLIRKGIYGREGFSRQIGTLLLLFHQISRAPEQFLGLRFSFFRAATINEESEGGKTDDEVWLTLNMEKHFYSLA